MSFLNSLNISASGMSAQKLRLDVAADNIANQETTRTEAGGPYRRKMVVLQAAEKNGFRNALDGAFVSGAKPAGVRAVQIAEDATQLNPVYDPSHPDADENGYVQMPNVDLVKETIDSMSATRSYDANITAFNAMKLMMQKALEIGK